MDDHFSNPMTPLDCLVSTHTLQMTKLLIPYLPPQNQRLFAVYVKFMEFQNTLSFFRTFQHKSHSFQDIMQDIRPYLPQDSCDAMDNILNLIQMMELFQSMSNTDDTDPMSFMSTMLTPEQQSMFDIYNSMFSENQGGDPVDRMDE